MSNYSRGANFERRVMKNLEARSWTVFRSAGSHSPVDLVAIRMGEVQLYQCQIDKHFAPGKRAAVIELARVNHFQAWLAWREGNKLYTKEITNEEVRKP